ncbi:hypothetical protein HK097_011450 [Rhizophlyctis rosea]|uniref:Formin GTPase-binding domain-containing protein n=1 Tax=Rhizophlyctis rosea TaxID=64517 RepID=A0AAD5S967_9FUNG|nr:hypothetical protein HK097_011450 [Rhizophlyctis rosea]
MTTLTTAKRIPIPLPPSTIRPIPHPPPLPSPPHQSIISPPAEPTPLPPDVISATDDPPKLPIEKLTTLSFGISADERSDQKAVKGKKGKGSMKPVMEFVDRMTNAMPESGMVDEAFEIAIDQLGIEDTPALRKLSKERKWEIVVMAEASSKDSPFRDVAKSKIPDDSEERYIRLLQYEGDKRKVSKDTLQALRVCLASKPDTWTMRFLELGGLEHLTAISLAMARENPLDIPWPTHLELVLTIQSLTHHKPSIGHLLQNPTILSSFSKLLFLRHLTPSPSSHPSYPHHHQHPSSAPPSSSSHSTKKSRPTSHIQILPPFDQSPPLNVRTHTLHLFTRLLTATRNPHSPTPDTQSLGASLAYNIVTSVLDLTKWPKSVWSNGSEEVGGVREEYGEAYKIWMKEFGECACWMRRVWSGGVKRAEGIFDSLADGTYRWQPIVQRAKGGVGERECVDYLIANLQLATLIVTHVPSGTVEDRVEARRLLEGVGFDDVLQKLSQSPHPLIKQLIRSYNHVKDADDATLAALLARTPRRMIRRVPARPLAMREAAAAAASRRQMEYEGVGQAS